MRHAILAALVATTWSISAMLPAVAAPQVCRQPVEGYDAYTDCFGTELTGASLRAAQIRDLVNEKAAPAEIAKLPDVKVVTIRSAADACPRGTVWIGSAAIPGETSNPAYDVQCAY